MEKIRTATGKVFDCDYMNPSEIHRQANVRILNSNVVAIATVFSNPAETKELVWGNAHAVGFTALLTIVNEGNAYRVVLGKEYR